MPHENHVETKSPKIIMFLVEMCFFEGKTYRYTILSIQGLMREMYVVDAECSLYYLVASPLCLKAGFYLLPLV